MSFCLILDVNHVRQTKLASSVVNYLMPANHSVFDLIWYHDTYPDIAWQTKQAISACTYRFVKKKGKDQHLYNAT